jgi:formate hydrogenlyase subunit 6/NADH:ubiquinone oxidoreductase subunit I
MRYNRKNGDVFDTEAPHTTRALLGLHPCDINALLLLDLVLADGAGGGSAAGSGYVDPYWEAARASTFIVGVSCMPTATCFCKTFDADEVHRGFDLFLTDLGDRWLVSCQTVAGAAILDRYVTTRDTTPTDLADFQLRTQRYKAAFSDDSLPTTDQLPLLYDAKYEWPLFDDIGETCLSCGACSMVCPVCYCFDVRDELEADGEAGKRCRNWDSCLFSEFAEVAHGHNFRPTRASRVRYRFYHKFVGNFTRFGKMLCVGCGRCSTACKVNIDPRRIIAALEEVTADDTRQDSKQGTSQDSKQKTTSQKAHTADVV